MPRLWKRWDFLIGLFLIVLITLFSFLTPLFHTFSYDELNLEMHNSPPNTTYWLGTDDLGRDILACLATGGRISLYVAFSALILDLVIGVFLGLVAGYAGGKVDEFIMRICDIFTSLPPLMLIILWVCMLGQGILSIIIALALTGWMNTARVVRSTTLQLKTMDYVQSAKALGASFYRILFYHLLPNASSSIIVSISLVIPSAIFTEAVLSFLQLGIAPPLTSLGSMIADGVGALAYFPWRIFFPSLFISLTMLGFTLIGYALRDTLDPKQRWL